LIAITLLLSAVVSNAQIKIQNRNRKNIRNCGMCETKIEKRGQKNIAAVDWDKDTKMATLIYDSKITNKDEILKRIVLVGYDSENSMRKRLLTARFLVVASMTEQLM
jgi:hypothetical protein